MFAFFKQVLGREVYTSNNQLGGIQIMHNNGVTHSTVCDDFEGVYTILLWLSYMPKVFKEISKLLSPGITLTFGFPDTAVQGMVGSGIGLLWQSDWPQMMMGKDHSSVVESLLCKKKASGLNFGIVSRWDLKCYKVGASQWAALTEKGRYGDGNPFLA